MQGRVISSRFSSHRASQQTTLCNIQKILLSSKMAAILIFEFCQKCKTQICFYLLNRARNSNFVEIFDPQSISAIYSCPSLKDFTLFKNGGYFEFLPKMQKHKFASISLTVRDRAISTKFLIHRVS